jgi:hypothetical protein
MGKKTTRGEEILLLQFSFNNDDNELYSQVSPKIMTDFAIDQQELSIIY